MKNLLCCIVGILLAMASATASAAQSSGKTGRDEDAVRGKLIGAWRLAWIEEEAADGKLAKLLRNGTLLYTRDGHMSVQIMAPTPGSPAENGPVQYEQGGHEAYFRTYEVNEQAHTVTHHVEGALVRSLIGNNLTRVYRFSDNQLVLKSSRPDEHWTIAWEHY